MDNIGQLIYKGCHSKKLIWISEVVIVGLLAIMMLIYFWITNSADDFWVSAIVVGGLFLFSFLVYIPLAYYESRKVFYNITTEGIELHGSKRYALLSYVFIPFRDLLWLGPSPQMFGFVFGKHKFLKWTVKWQMLNMNAIIKVSQN